MGVPKKGKGSSKGKGSKGKDSKGSNVKRTSSSHQVAGSLCLPCACAGRDMRRGERPAWSRAEGTAACECPACLPALRRSQVWMRCCRAQSSKSCSPARAEGCAGCAAARAGRWAGGAAAAAAGARGRRAPLLGDAHAGGGCGSSAGSSCPAPRLCTTPCERRLLSR